MEVIEPSEIFVEGKASPHKKTARMDPWIRFWARFFDYALFFFCLWLFRKLFEGYFSLGYSEGLIPIEYFIWIPIEALLLTTWGTTPGKFFLKIYVKPLGKKKFDYRAALRRSFHVWFRGLGLGIPIINIVCLLTAYQRLKLSHQTSWDRDDHIQVTHAPIAKWRIILVATIAISGVFLYFRGKEQFTSKNVSVVQVEPREKRALSGKVI